MLPSARVSGLLCVCLLELERDKGKDKDASEVKFAAGAKQAGPTLVTDKSGNHISGLKQEDFTVLENGAQQKIATFEEITSDPHRLSSEIPTNSIMRWPAARLLGALR